MRRRTLAMGLISALVVCTSGMILVQAGPQTAGVDLGPDRTQQAEPGENITYDHVLTNTGAITDTFSVDVLSTQGWPVGLTSESHPTETQVLTLELGSQISTALQVSLTVPIGAGGATEETLATATSQFSPTVSATATDTTRVLAAVYLPFAARRWPLPPPDAPLLHDIDNSDCDSQYEVSWSRDPKLLTDAYFLEEAECTYFCDEFEDPSVVYSGTETAWSMNTPKAPGTFLYRARGQNATGYGEYSEIEAATVVPEPSSGFLGVINQLDTPEELSSFLLNELEWVFHDGCISYWPEEFYALGEGDCKDFATFASYVLAHHGYYAEVVSYSGYWPDGTRFGHVVVIYEGPDGVLRYMSNGEIMDQVDSVEDLLEKEADNANARIGHYLVLPPGTATICTH